MKKSVIIALIGLLPMAVHAQKDSTLNRTVVVENEYNPTVMDASKINVLPKIAEPTVAKKAAEYATALRTVSMWNYEPMEAIEKRIQGNDPTRGYLKAGYGNYGNVDFGVGYLWDPTNIDRFKIDLSLVGMNGDLHKAGYGRDGDWGSRHYTTDLDLAFNHLFNSVSLDLGGGFTNQVFNYLGFGPDENTPWTGKYRQHHTIGDFFARITTRDKDLPIQFMFQTGFQYFSQKHATVNADDTNERKIHTVAGIWKPLSDEQVLGLDLGMDNLFYSNSVMHDYTSLLLNPYYAYNDDSWRVRLGAHVDWLSGDDGGVDVAPNLKAEYIFSDSYIFYVSADGGRKLNDYQRLNNISRYWTIPIWLKPSYTQLDATIGFRASPMNGLWLNIYGGYRVIKDETFGRLEPYGEMSGEIVNPTFAAVVFLQDKAKIPYIGGDIKYSYKDLLELNLSTSYFSWSINGIEGYDDQNVLLGKVKYQLDLGAKAKIFEGLFADAGFYYAKRCADFITDVNDLHVGAEYEFLKNISAYAQIHNIMNKEYEMIGYPQEKFNFIVGFKAHF